jgi:NADH dehydrogenase
MILVAGGTGFIGSAVVRALRAHDADVTVMTSRPERSRDRVERMGATVVRGDVLDPDSLADAVRGAEVVVQALTFPTFPVEKPRKGYTFDQFDGAGTERLMAAAAGAGVTRYVYASAVGAAPDGPKPWYRAKWRGEEALRRSGLEQVIIRPSWVYGPGDISLNKFVTFHRWLPFVPVVGDGRQQVQPVFVDDVGQALAKAASPGGPQGTFEIGGPDVLTMNEVIRQMMEVRGKRKPLLHLPPWFAKTGAFFLQYLPGAVLSPGAIDFGTADAVADTESLLEAFDVRPRTLREGLGTYLR